MCIILTVFSHSYICNVMSYHVISCNLYFFLTTFKISSTWKLLKSNLIVMCLVRFFVLSSCLWFIEVLRFMGSIFIKLRKFWTIISSIFFFPSDLTSFSSFWDSIDYCCMHWRRKWQLTPVFLPGESQRLRSLVGRCLGSHRVGHDWSDLAAVAAADSC